MNFGFWFGTFGYGIAPGSGVSFATNGTQITISSTGGSASNAIAYSFLNTDLPAGITVTNIVDATHVSVGTGTNLTGKFNGLQVFDSSVQFVQILSDLQSVGFTITDGVGLAWSTDIAGFISSDTWQFGSLGHTPIDSAYLQGSILATSLNGVDGSGLINIVKSRYTNSPNVFFNTEYSGSFWTSATNYTSTLDGTPGTTTSMATFLSTTNSGAIFITNTLPITVYDLVSQTNCTSIVTPPGTATLTEIWYNGSTYFGRFTGPISNDGGALTNLHSIPFGTISPVSGSTSNYVITANVTNAARMDIMNTSSNFNLLTISNWPALGSVKFKKQPVDRLFTCPTNMNALYTNGLAVSGTYWSATIPSNRVELSIAWEKDNGDDNTNTVFIFTTAPQ